MQVANIKTLRIPMKGGDVVVELEQAEGSSEFFLKTRSAYSKLEDTLKKWNRENLQLNEKQYPAYLAKKKVTSPRPSPQPSPRSSL